MIIPFPIMMQSHIGFASAIHGPIFDYSKHPDTWMKPLTRGEVTGLVERPASWYLDDLPPMVSASPPHFLCIQQDVHVYW